MARYDDDRRYGRYSDRDDDRGVMDRASDEVQSWFGDDDAQRRRRRDETRGDRDDRDRFGGSYRDRDGDSSRGRYSGRGDRARGSNRYRDEDDLQERYDRDYNRSYVRDFGDHSGNRGHYEGDRMSYGQSRYGSDRDYGSSRMRSRDMDDDDRYGSNRGGGRRDYGDQDYGSSRMRSGGMGTGSDRYGSDRGPHAGRGPEGYSRSSDRITEDVNEALTDHGGVDASKIRVSVEDGEVTLEGTVSSRREKRMAEDAAEDARGVRDVHNRLTLSDEDSDDASSNASSGTSTSGKKARKAAASS